MNRDLITGYIVDPKTSKRVMVGQSVQRNSIYEQTKQKAKNIKAKKYFLQFSNGKSMWFTL